jgi:hypothetical protein
MSYVYLGQQLALMEVFRRYDGGLGGPMITLEVVVLNDGFISPCLNVLWRADSRHNHHVVERLL